MGFSPRKCLAFSAFISLVLFGSCDKHPVGELPEVQKEHNYPENHHEAESGSVASPTPSAKPTPADFFPETKPQ